MYKSRRIMVGKRKGTVEVEEAQESITVSMINMHYITYMKVS